MSPAPTRSAAFDAPDRVDPTPLLRRPVIGVTTQTLHAIEGIPAGLPESWVMNQRYFRAVTAVGGAPVMLPLFADDLATVRAVYERIDGILIPGGVDMQPATYGEATRPEVGRLDPARDTVELELVRWAMADGMPVLGLCRGAQVINVAAGGTLYQDIPAQLGTALTHDCYPTRGFARDHLAHPVALTRGSRLEALLDAPSVSVNSMHHQSVKTLGDGLLVSAVAPDGVVEAVEGRGEAFLLGVQWHPEVFDADNPTTRPLFTAFVRAAVAYGQERNGVNGWGVNG
jgi:putative glutamine amidotransferase